MSGDQANLEPASPGPAFERQPGFSYGHAFDRNIGWLTEWEQMALRGKRVAIAGLGGVGGFHLLTLTRLGIGGFSIADFDRFDIANFNRQTGATVATVGEPKLDVLAAAAREINPELRLRSFPEGVTPSNLDAFLEGADLFVDGIDFFALDARRMVFARCAERGIPAITAAPIGMGAAWLSFVPGGMSFERYFRLAGRPEAEQYIRFLVGMAPRGLHRAYLVDPGRVDFAARRGPSTVAACQLCAGVTAVTAAKLLLRRDDTRAAPWHHHFDPYRFRLARTWLRWGNASPVQRLKVAIARRAIPAMRPPDGIPSPPCLVTPLDHILDAARWAPSGDNQQPWRFEVDGPDSVIVHVDRASPDNVYEYREGEPLLLAAGMLLASLRVAASAWKRDLDWDFLGTGGTHRIAVRFAERAGVKVDPWLGSLPLRSVDRGLYRRRPLTAIEREGLAGAVGSGLRLDWHEGLRARWRIAKLNGAATDIRLRAPETFATHRKVIDWARRFSPTGVPSRSLGLPGPMLRLLRWSMADWARMDRANRLGGTLSAAAQTDYLPAIGSAAFFVLRAETPWPRGEPLATLRAGEAVQRFWLEATRLGLAIQPALATVIFADHGARDTAFTARPELREKARRLAGAFRETLGDPGQVVFMGRIGEAPARLPTSRSVRLPLSSLRHRSSQPPGSAGVTTPPGGAS